MELLSRVLGAGEEDPDLISLSVALKAKLGPSDSKKPPPSMSVGLELLTRDVKSCKGIGSSTMEMCPVSFHPCLRTLPVCNVGHTSEANMKSYGLAALAPVASTHGPQPLEVERGTRVYHGGEHKRSRRRTFGSNSQSSLTTKLPNQAEEFS